MARGSSGRVSSSQAVSSASSNRRRKSSRLDHEEDEMEINPREIRSAKRRVAESKNKVEVVDLDDDGEYEEEEEEEFHFTQSQAFTIEDKKNLLESRNLSKSIKGKTLSKFNQKEKDQLHKKRVKDIVRCILYENASKSLPITSKELRNAVCPPTETTPMDPNQFKVALCDAQIYLRNTFGFDIVSIGDWNKPADAGASASGPFLLVNVLDDENNLFTINDAKGKVKRGLLMIIFSLVFLSKGCIKLADLWKQLSAFGFDKSPSISKKESVHPEYTELGDIQMLVEQTFVKEKYLRKKKDDNNRDDDDVPHVEIRLGARCYLEVGKEQILQFVSQSLDMKLNDEQKKNFMTFEDDEMEITS